MQTCSVRITYGLQAMNTSQQNKQHLLSLKGISLLSLSETKVSWQLAIDQCHHHLAHKIYYVSRLLMLTNHSAQGIHLCSLGHFCRVRYLHKNHCALAITILCPHCQHTHATYFACHTQLNKTRDNHTVTHACYPNQPLLIAGPSCLTL